eukprot:TRINITY_DN3235_c3_g1_i1.p1 TRINITY_DN3235_c3_g1~~TRINITY_DN3235_c3_g1_i1.p1  ORF type:complete len:3006 (+),score=960.67 TRINITY_DN3235_c3_g1_i1:1168-9018(+)
MTQGGQRTLWIRFAAPCEKCALELSLCYENAAAAGVAQACLANGASGDEVLNGPVLASRTIQTKPFTVRPPDVNQAVIVGQKVPPTGAPTAIGAPFTVTIEPMVEMAGGWLYEVSNVMKKARPDVKVYAEPRVRWMDGGLDLPPAALRYGNGGFLRVAESTAAAADGEPTAAPAGAGGGCSEGADLTGLSRTSGRRLLVQQASKLQIAELLGRGIVSAWWAEPLRFRFVRPCSRCTVYVRAWLYHGDALKSEWKAPLRAPDLPGTVLEYQVLPCGVKWIWGGTPVVYVQRRRPFSLTAAWADPNGFPTWQGATPVSGGIRLPKLGGTLAVTSPLTSESQVSLMSEGGVATFRMAASRACWQCSYYLADLEQPVIVASEPTRAIAIPRSIPYQPYQADDEAAVQQSELFVFDIYLADELGDRSYLNPSYLPRLTPYQQEPQALLPLAIRSASREFTRGLKLRDRAGHPVAIQLVQRAVTPNLVYGRYLANGIPVDPETPHPEYECGAHCRPGTLAFTLRDAPTYDFELSYLDVGGRQLPIHLNGEPSAPRVSWAVPPCCVVFNDTTASVISGRELTLTFLIIGGLPGTDYAVAPGNSTFYISTHALTHKPSVAIECQREGQWQPVRESGKDAAGGVYEWGQNYQLGGGDGGSIALSLVVTLAGDAEVDTTCTARVNDVLPNANAYVPWPSGGLTGAYIPEQKMEFTVRPGGARLPDTWSWVAPWDSPTTDAAALNTLVSRELTLSLYGYRADGGPCAASSEILGEESLISLELVPAECFQMQGSFTVGQTARGPVVQWTGVLPSTSRCQIPNVRGLPSGEIMQPLYSLYATRRDKVEVASGLAMQLHHPGDGSAGPAAWRIDTGVENVMELHVVDARGDRVYGDYVTSVGVAWARCEACCATWHHGHRKCGAFDPTDPPPQSPAAVTAVDGLIRIPFTVPRGTDVRKDTTSLSVVHIPWVATLTVSAGAAPGETLAALPPVIASVRASSLRVAAAFAKDYHLTTLPAARSVPVPPPHVVAGDADALQVLATEGAPIPWVVGFTFDLKITAADAAVPFNIPRTGQPGAAAKVTMAPAAIPCHDTDVAGFTWCPACAGGAWNGTASHLWSTCLAPPAAAAAAPPEAWGRCEWESFPQCSMEAWRVAGSKGFTAQSVVLDDGIAWLPRTVYVGPPRPVFLRFSSDSLLEGAPYTAAVALDMQAVGRLEIQADFVSSCRRDVPEETAGGAAAADPQGRWERTVCAVEGFPFVAPPPVEPIQDENEVWYFPDRGFNHINPADLDPVGEGVMDLKINVVETGPGGGTVRGDSFNRVRLSARCLDPDPEKRARFYFGRVSTDLAARELIERVDPDAGWVAPVVNGVASFPRVGFHSYCADTRLYADCVVDPSRDELRHCAGLHVELEPFQVGERDAELLAPVAPPSAPPPPKTNPSVELFLGSQTTCASFNPDTFAAAMRASLSKHSATPISAVTLHHGCAIPASRLRKGIRSYDLDGSRCCLFTSAPVDETPQDGGQPAAATDDEAPAADAPQAGGDTPGDAAPAFDEASGVRGVLRVEDSCKAATKEYLWQGLHDGAPQGVGAVRCCPDTSAPDYTPGGANCTVARAEGAEECLPLAVTYSDAVLACYELGMVVCSADELAGDCCNLPAAAACDVASEPAWARDLQLTTADIDAQGDAVCTEVVSSEYATLAAANGLFATLTLSSTQHGCAAACCAAGFGECVGFERASGDDAAKVAPCTLVAPHPPMYRVADPARRVFFIYANVDPTPSPNATAGPVTARPDGLCEDREETQEGCEWPDRENDLYDCVFDARVDRCRIASYCKVNERVVDYQCVACRGTTTRAAGDEVHGGNTYCYACDGVLNGTAELDVCGMCGGDNTACLGCDGVPNSGYIHGPCGDCIWFNTTEAAATAAAAGAAPVAVGDLSCRSCAALPTAEVGTKVYRGPDWAYGDQDGGKSVGEVVSFAPCTRGGGRWLTVRWAPQYDEATGESTSYVNSYRAGCDGKYDLAVKACVDATCPYPTCALASDAGQAACLELGCLWNAAEGTCSGELAVHAMCPCVGWSKAGCADNPECGWVDGLCGEQGVTCLKDQRVLNGTCVACALGLTNPAGDPVTGPDTDCLGCDGVRGSGLIFDVCGVCAGDGASCAGCDGVPNSGATADACGVCNGDGACHTCAVTMANAALELAVTHGPDWTGPTGKTGQGGFIAAQKDACEGGYWYTVTWQADGSTGWYRVGCYGAYDLAVRACAANVTAAIDACYDRTLSGCKGGDGATTEDAALTIFEAVPPDWVCAVDDASMTCRGSRCAHITARASCDADVRCLWGGGSCGESACADVECPRAVCYHAGACDPAAGSCAAMTVQEDGTPCDDGKADTFGDACKGGVCTPSGVCRDNATRLAERLADNATVPTGYEPGMSCNDTYTLGGVACGAWFSDGEVCCATCVAREGTALPGGEGGDGVDVAAPHRGGQALGAFTRRALLQVVEEEVEESDEEYYFVVEMEVALEGETNADNQDAVIASVYASIAAAVADRTAAVCTTYYDICAEWDSLCNATAVATCPVVAEIRPVDIPDVVVTSPPPTPVPIPTRPRPLSPSERGAAGAVAPAWALLILAAALCTVAA